MQTQPHTISLVVFKPKGMELEIQFTSGETRESHYPTEVSALELERLLDDRDIPYKATGSGETAWWSILTYLLPFILFFGFWIFLMNRGQEKRRDSRRGLSEDYTGGPDDTG